jgi:hypothetical protein
MSNINNGSKSPNADLINQLLPMLFNSLEELLEDCVRLIEYIPPSEKETCIELLAKIQFLSSNLPHTPSEDENTLVKKDFIEELEVKLAILSDRALKLEPLIQSNPNIKTYFSMLAHELTHVRKSVNEVLKLY